MASSSTLTRSVIRHRTDPRGQGGGQGAGQGVGRKVDRGVGRGARRRASQASPGATPRAAHGDGRAPQPQQTRRSRGVASPSLTAAVPAVAAVVASGRGHAHAEFELRLCTVTEDGACRAGVTEAVFTMLRRSMSACVPECTELQMSTDFHYDHKYRCRVEVDLDTLGLRVSTIRKERKKMAVVFLGSPTRPATLACRATTSIEHPHDEPDSVIAAHRVQLVRLKERQAFTLRGGDHAPTWTYDFTRVWTGKTKAEADHKRQTGDDPVYEVEIEALPAYLVRFGDPRVAESALLKLLHVARHALGDDALDVGDPTRCGPAPGASASAWGQVDPDAGRVGETRGGVTSG